MAAGHHIPSVLASQVEKCRKLAAHEWPTPRGGTADARVPFPRVFKPAALPLFPSFVIRAARRSAPL